MRKASRPQGFTLIELLTVIAIIAVLAAILFPVAGTVREQARSGDCMSKLHQLWVSATMYKMDEGDYPPALLGYVESAATHDFVTPSVPPAGYAPIDQVINGFLYREQVRDVNVFRCPDNLRPNKLSFTIAHFPPKPARWNQTGAQYIGDALAGPCGTDGFGTIDCFTSGPNAGQPKVYYTWDSYDIGPRIDPVSGRAVLNAGVPVYDVHYSRDWTGRYAADDWPAQLKYSNPPDDKTLLAYCTWHTATAGATTYTSVSMGGTAKKLDAKLFSDWGPYVYSR